MKKRTSIYDIAQRLGVSVSSVSRALSDHPSISAALKERIREVAAELHYTPNSVAVNLKTGRRNTIGVVVPGINRSFFSSAIEGIEDKAYKQGYDVLIYQSKDSAEREERIVHSLAGKVDGVIASVAADTTDHSYYNHLSASGVPVVLFDRTAPGVDAGTVIVDDYQGAAMAVKHLLRQGLTRICHCAGPQHVNVWSNRLKGYLDTMQEAGISIPENYIFEGANTTEEEGRRFARTVLAEGSLPEAVFFAGDFAALGAMLEFRKAGVRIPEDIAIVGFANEPFCQLLPTPLSSVDQFSYKMGYMAGKMMFDRLRGEPQVGIVIAPELIIRKSSLKTIHNHV
ncbi:LacI family DNA-binding transcriptional regulator [Rikenella microfusus]|uniref:Degradation activator n=1 Tax=Rikenella microfusus TaxID=28139 RepID=A0A379MSF1_9BACT|nr:LacI family DNA-binding transcriptional regulator [Rikenella microfusus]SUE34453.1 Degradation activator [Rikenella microfusus]